MPVEGGPCLRLAGLGDLAGISHFISTRGGRGLDSPRLNLAFGLSDPAAAVVANRRCLFGALGIDPRRVALVRQVHGRSVVVVTDGQHDGLAPPDRLTDADAMVTTSPGLWLAVLVADCVPVLAADPVRGAVGIAHAGWRGTVAGVTTALLGALTGKCGCQPQDLHVAVGPSIGPDDYEVGAQVARRFADAFPEAAGVVRRDRRGRYFVDLWQANVHQARAAGVPGRNIEVAGISTAGCPDLFFSHRVEGLAAGRFAAGVALC